MSSLKRKPKKLVVVPPPETPNERILRIARSEIGVKETRGGETTRILEYHDATTGKFDEDEIPWCASFICWVLEKAKLVSTNSALAASYIKWGKKINSLHEAVPGDIIVRTRAGGNHVHILNERVSKGADTYKGLGGNQSDAVNIKSYGVTGVIAIRRAEGEKKT